MPQFLVFTLMLCALLLPVVGAIVVRLLRPRFTDQLLYAIAALFLVITVISVIILARSDVTTIRIAGLAILLPDDGVPELPTQYVPSTEDPLTSATSELSPTEQLLTPVVPLDLTATEQPSVQRTETPIPPTETPIPPTETPIPPTETPIPPTETPIPPTETAAPAGPRRYTIQSGDTLRSIAERFGVSVQAILQANRLSPAQADTLRPGQELVIP